MKFWCIPDLSWFPKIESLKSFGILWGNSYIPCVLLTITHCFTCGEIKIWKSNRNYHSTISMIVSKNFILLLMSLLTVRIVKNRHLLAGVCFIILKNCHWSNLKVFRYHNWNSVKISEKELPDKTRFNTFLQLSYSNFRLKLCKVVTKIVKKIKSFEILISIS